MLYVRTLLDPLPVPAIVDSQEMGFLVKVMSNMTFIDKSNDHCNSFQISMSVSLHDLVIQMPHVWTLLDPLSAPAIVDFQEMGFLVKVMSIMIFIDKSNDHCNSFQISMSVYLHNLVMQMPRVWTLLDPLLVPAIMDSQGMDLLVKVMTSMYFY